jgi:DNA-binding NtrC family response regulator
MTWTIDTTDKSAHILVEDNDASIRENMTSLLAVEGYECRVAETLVEKSTILSSGGEH